jgi:hypothetical protein
MRCKDSDTQRLPALTESIGQSVDTEFPPRQMKDQLSTDDALASIGESVYERINDEWFSPGTGKRSWRVPDLALGTQRAAKAKRQQPEP